LAICIQNFGEETEREECNLESLGVSGTEKTKYIIEKQLGKAWTE
jgi:hypothetical protein